MMGANGSNYTGCLWTHGTGYCHIVWWMRGNWNHLNLRKKNWALVEERKKKDMFKSLSCFFPLLKCLKWWEARPSPPHLHCFLPLLVFMGTYSSFQSFLWITDAAARSCFLLCSLTITSLERLWFCVCKCNSCRGGLWFFAGERFQNVGSGRLWLHYHWVFLFFSCTCRHTYLQSKSRSTGTRGESAQERHEHFNLI